MLHRYSDGSVLKLMNSRELVMIPVWKGQRILNQEHADSIKESIGPNVSRLDSGYTIIKYKEVDLDSREIIVSYLIDGQHRASVLRDYYKDVICEPGFQVTVTEKEVESESDAIDYFNTINNAKPQCWSDPTQIVNKYMMFLEKKFNTNRKCLLIRPGSTNRPYLSSEKLREVLKKNIQKTTKHTTKDVEDFVDKVDKLNKATLRVFELETTQERVKDSAMKERAVAIKFSLAYDTQLKWVQDLF
jgi:hypothetical protein